jgi:predicted transposase/invertase (TIGR01784 family)
MSSAKIIAMTRKEVAALQAARISPTSDLAFKKVLASEDTKDVLAGFISDILLFTPADITLKNPYSIDIYSELLKGNDINKLRQTIKDVAASLKTLDFISEMHVRRIHFFDERVLYYPFDAFCKNYNQAIIPNSAGVIRYSSLKPVYSINILDFIHFKDDSDALRVLELYDPKRRKALEKKYLQIAFFELGKQNFETENQRHWRDYFKTGEVKDTAPAYIKKASEIIKFVNMREEERNMVLAYEKAQALYEAEIDYARWEGREEGWGDGVDKTEMAFDMLRQNKDIAEIQNMTKLPAERLLSFKKILGI